MHQQVHGHLRHAADPTLKQEGTPLLQILEGIPAERAGSWQPHGYAIDWILTP